MTSSSPAYSPTGPSKGAAWQAHRSLATEIVAASVQYRILLASRTRRTLTVGTSLRHEVRSILVAPWSFHLLQHLQFDSAVHLAHNSSLGVVRILKALLEHQQGTLAKDGYFSQSISTVVSGFEALNFSTVSFIMLASDLMTPHLTSASRTTLGKLSTSPR